MAGGDQDGDALVRDFELPDLEAALAFVSRVGDLAEEATTVATSSIHGYGHVRRLTLSPHSEGRVTEKDHAPAERIDALRGRR